MPKEKEKNITDKNINETPADRLNIVILKYFKTKKEVADLFGINRVTLTGYTLGRNTITLKFAMRLQETTGINADYILNGNDPMMIDATTRKPVFEGDVPSISKVDTKTLHGIIKRYTLEYEGNRQVLTPEGESSVVNLVLGNLEENTSPFQVRNNLAEFEQDYNIKEKSTLILKKDYIDGDLVLFSKNNKKYEIGIFREGEITALKTKIKHKEEDIQIKGRLVAKFENIRFDEKTGRIF